MRSGTPWSWACSWTDRGRMTAVRCRTAAEKGTHEALVAIGRVGDRAVRHGPRPVGDERLDQPAGRGLRHDGHHDPGRHHPLLPGHGHADAHRRQDRRHHRPPQGLRHRPDHLRLRLGHDRGGADGGGPDPGLVDPGGHRRRAGPAGDGGADRRQLRRGVAQGGLRHHRRGRRRRHRHRPHPRGLGHHGAELAGGLRRRGRPRRSSSWPWSATSSTRPIEGAKPRLDVVGSVLAASGLGLVVLGHPAVEHLGLGGTEGLARSSRSASR